MVILLIYCQNTVKKSTLYDFFPVPSIQPFHTKIPSCHKISPQKRENRFSTGPIFSIFSLMSAGFDLDLFKFLLFASSFSELLVCLYPNKWISYVSPSSSKPCYSSFYFSKLPRISMNKAYKAYETFSLRH